MSDSFERRRQALEEEFFKKQSQDLLEKLRDQMETEQPRAVLARVTGIKDDKVLDTLLSLNLSHETLAAFALYPLVEVAWADGRVDDREREALLKAAAEQGLAPGTAIHGVFEDLLREAPRPEVRAAWYASRSRSGSARRGPARRPRSRRASRTRRAPSPRRVAAFSVSVAA